MKRVRRISWMLLCVLCLSLCTSVSVTAETGEGTVPTLTWSVAPRAAGEEVLHLTLSLSETASVGGIIAGSIPLALTFSDDAASVVPGTWAFVPEFEQASVLENINEAKGTAVFAFEADTVYDGAILTVDVAYDKVLAQGETLELAFATAPAYRYTPDGTTVETQASFAVQNAAVGHAVSDIFLRGYQIAPTSEDTYSFRAVAEVVGLSYRAVGFVLSFTYNGQEYSVPSKNVTTVYTSLHADYGQSQILPEEGHYLTSIALNGCPTASDIVFTVTPYVVTADGVTYYGDTRTATILGGTVQ